MNRAEQNSLMQELSNMQQRIQYMQSIIQNAIPSDAQMYADPEKKAAEVLDNPTPDALENKAPEDKNLAESEGFEPSDV